MFLKFDHLREKRLAGLRCTMSFKEDQTYRIWRAFMPRRTETGSSLYADLYSVEIFPSPDFFDHFDPEKEFEKWAAVESAADALLPAGMESLIIPAGLYAIFHHKGPASEGAKTYRLIFENWMPASGYGVDDRPHFAVMGEKYRGEDPESEEEIWIPVRHDTNRVYD